MTFVKIDICRTLHISFRFVIARTQLSTYQELHNQQKSNIITEIHIKLWFVKTTCNLLRIKFYSQAKCSTNNLKISLCKLHAVFTVLQTIYNHNLSRTVVFLFHNILGPNVPNMFSQGRKSVKTLLRIITKYS